VRLKVAASKPGPFTIDVGFYSAEEVLFTVPVKIRGEAVKKE
jgi:hypothetical protein